MSLTVESRDWEDRDFGFAGGEGFLAPRRLNHGFRPSECSEMCVLGMS